MVSTFANSHFLFAEVDSFWIVTSPARHHHFVFNSDLSF